MDRDQIKEILGGFPRHRTHLLPALRAVQEELHWLPTWAMEEIGAYLRVSRRARSTASHRPFLNSG